MSKFSSLAALFKAICDALREKTGTTDPIKHTDIPDMINGLVTKQEDVDAAVAEKLSFLTDWNRFFITKERFEVLPTVLEAVPYINDLTRTFNNLSVQLDSKQEYHVNIHDILNKWNPEKKLSLDYTFYDSGLYIDGWNDCVFDDFNLYLGYTFAGKVMNPHWDLSNVNTTELSYTFYNNQYVETVIMPKRITSMNCTFAKTKKISILDFSETDLTECRFANATIEDSSVSIIKGLDLSGVSDRCYLGRCSTLTNITFKSNGQIGSPSSTRAITFDLSKMSQFSPEGLHNMIVTLADLNDEAYKPQGDRIIKVAQSLYEQLTDEQLAEVTDKGYLLTSE